MKTIKSWVENSPFEPLARYIYKKIKYVIFRDIYEDTISKSSGKILIACFPKSGSSFTANVLSELSDYKKEPLVFAYGAREQELDPRKIFQLRNSCFVAQHHVKCSGYTEKLVKQYNLTTVVLVRNIFDVIVSLADHFRNTSITGPMAYIAKEHIEQLSDQELYCLIADLVVPWYINFYVGWTRSSLKPLIVKYEDLIDEPIKFFKTILELDGCELSSKEISDAIALSKNNKKSRINKGVKGRGSLLPEVVEKRVKKLASYYPFVDFSKIGI